MRDILFHTDNYVFSYRVAGILLRDNKILLQKPTNDTGFAIPGGHAEFGETNAETLEIITSVKLKRTRRISMI